MLDLWVCVCACKCVCTCLSGANSKSAGKTYLSRDSERTCCLLSPWKNKYTHSHLVGTEKTRCVFRPPWAGFFMSQSNVPCIFSSFVERLTFKDTSEEPEKILVLERSQNPPLICQVNEVIEAIERLKKHAVQQTYFNFHKTHTDLVLVLAWKCVEEGTSFDTKKIQAQAKCTPTHVRIVKLE